MWDGVGGRELLQEANWEVTSVNSPGRKGSLSGGPAGAQVDGPASARVAGGEGRQPTSWPHPLLSVPTRPGPGPRGHEAG